MSSTLQQLERMRGDLSRLIEQAAQEEAPAFEDSRAYQAGRQDMRSAVVALLTARADELFRFRQGREAGALLGVISAVERMA